MEGIHIALVYILELERGTGGQQVLSKISVGVYI